MCASASPSPTAVRQGGGGILSPVDRLTELTYGILLVLTFTGTLRVAERDGGDVGSSLWAAAGCCLAWAVVDGAMYMFGCLASRSRDYHLLQLLRDDPDSARRNVAAALPDQLAATVPAETLDSLVASLAEVPIPPRPGLQRDDVLGGLGIFLLANAALVPLVAPFALIDDLGPARHLSNGIALAMLFGAGFKLAHYTGERPLQVAVRFATFGVVLVGVTIALGG